MVRGAMVTAWVGLMMGVGSGRVIWVIRMMGGGTGGWR